MATIAACMQQKRSKCETCVMCWYLHKNNASLCEREHALKYHCAIRVGGVSGEIKRSKSDIV